MASTIKTALNNEENVKTRKRKLSHELDDGNDQVPNLLSACDTEDLNNKNAENQEHAILVADHYNHLEEKGIKDRFNSPIFYLRNFNNWVKSVLIQEYTDKVKEKDFGRPLRVLDICCGKGGDLSKWQKARVERVICADIAEVSVQQCEARYKDLKRHCRGHLFSAEFICADCTKTTLRDKYSDPSINFDAVSCQFGLHYSFESLAQARRLLINISECLKPGGFFFGTIPNAHEIVTRAQKSDGEFGNRIYKIKLLFDHEQGFPLFGAKYDFHLEEVVNCPEFLVNFQLFVKLAAEFGLELVYKAGFEQFYKDHSEKYKYLLEKIKCFECYPAPPGKHLIGLENEYDHAKVFWDGTDKKSDNNYIGTMSTAEWQVATIYMAFAFKKQKCTWNSEGKAVYLTSKEKPSTCNT